MLHSEKRSLIRFLVIYLLSTLLLFSFASWIFYSATKDHLLDKQRESLKYEAESIKSALRKLHKSNSVPLVYPYNPLILSAIFDSNKEYIFGTFGKDITFDEKRKSGHLYYMSKVEPYYMGVAYLLTVKQIDVGHYRQTSSKHIFLYVYSRNFFLHNGVFLR